MTELRVALFTGNYNHIRDGVSLTLNRLVHYLESQDIPVLVFGPSVKNPAIDHCGELVVTPSIPMLVPGREEYRIATHFSRSAKKRLEEFNPTLIHIATPDGLGIGGLRWAKKHGIPKVTSYHTHFLSYADYYATYLNPIKKPFKMLMKWFYKQFTHTYVPSQSMIDELHNEGIPGNMKIWARGIDTERFNPGKRDMEWRRSVGFDDDDIVVTFVSRLVWEKELRTYIDSVSRIQKKYPKVRALIVGDGQARKEAEQLLPNGHFTGFAKGEDLARAYASADIFLFPSHTETFGNVTLEAMSSGLPCIVADAIGSKSLVDNGVNGFWAKKESVDDFTNQLEKVVADSEMRIKMGKTSRKMAMEYEWDSINAGLVKNYREVLKNSKKG
ncbi:MAG: glycosyltransferase family 1 protein [Balneolaceae bacterium]|nr:glycosyltransferase family 1 protein [Balneolaceae bacterium]MBO6547553.1 glycosyltransferase family 1 protein [Balneolaceae bacterium]MBO6648065.1 glycosyltransferase family 1 protein [Balneolaceae bacterium]